MNWKNTSASWGSVARSLHWLMALMILAQLAAGWIADQMDTSPDKISVMTGHKSMGVTIGLLLLFRLAWRLSNPIPLPAAGTSRLTVIMSRAVHWALYLLAAALPLTGWLVADTSRLPWKLWWLIPVPDAVERNRQLHETAQAAHGFLAWALLAVMAIHVAAAAWHHFGKRDVILRRMWSG